MHAKGADAGQRFGYALGYDAAKDEKAAASWAASPEGQAAYRLALAGHVRELASCSRPGWYIKDGFCYPAPAAKGLYGWRVEPPK
jgi:hypothetical protein